MNRLEKLIFELYNKDIIKFGNFTLKSGKQSNVYIDLRNLIAYPQLLEMVSGLMYEKILHNVMHNDMKYDTICGISYTGIPLATSISIQQQEPFLILRKEKKEYGTKKMVEGMYKKGDVCLLIDDVISDGQSKIESIEELQKEGIEVKDIFVFLDRRESQNEFLCDKYKVHSIINLDQVLNILCGGKERLKNIIYVKKSNLVLSADLQNTEQILDIVESVSEYICGVKIHVDIIENFSQDFITKLKKLSKEKYFFIIADRKFSDIGNTVHNQLHGGVYKISSWADLVTVHTVMGEGTIEGLLYSQNSHFITPQLLLLAQASSKNNLISKEYTKKTIELAEKYKNNVFGFICQEKLLEEKSNEFYHFTPGVNMNDENDKLGQQYNSPKYVIEEKGSDIIIVGRGIYNSSNPRETAKNYRDVAWPSFYNKK